MLRRHLPWLFAFALGLALGIATCRPKPAVPQTPTFTPESVDIRQPGEPQARRYRVAKIANNDDVRAEGQGLMLVMLWWPRDEQTGSLPYTALWCEPK